MSLNRLIYTCVYIFRFKLPIRTFAIKFSESEISSFTFSLSRGKWKFLNFFPATVFRLQEYYIKSF